MFGFSFAKILVLAVIVTAVWYGFRWLERRKANPPSVSAKAKSASGTGPEIGAQDTVKCPQCDAFVVAKGAKSCGRADCPYGV